MKTVEVRGVKIGEGIPKICVSVMGITRNDIIERAKELKEKELDIVEWRADWYCDVLNHDKLLSVLPQLREELGEIPLLFTFRTMHEGGEKNTDIKDYVDICKAVIRSGYVDMIDVELYMGEHQVKEIVEEAHAYQVKVVISNHDFGGTPKKDEIVRRLYKMQELGADIAKIAVLPKNKKDVLTLLTATEKVRRNPACCPLITISMGKEGAISRVCGEFFGSAATFGAVGKVSAPGQIEAKKLREMMECLHSVAE